MIARDFFVGKGRRRRRRRRRRRSRKRTRSAGVYTIAKLALSNWRECCSRGRAFTAAIPSRDRSGRSSGGNPPWDQLSYTSKVAVSIYIFLSFPRPRRRSSVPFSPFFVASLSSRALHLEPSRNLCTQFANSRIQSTYRFDRVRNLFNNKF